MASYPDFETVRSSLHNAFAETNNEVYKMVSDVRFSGSTCTSIITYGRKVYCANVGDSRTILIRQAPNGDGKFHNRNSNPIYFIGCLVRSLSRDHKPDDPEEARVIHANNGRIDSYRDQLGN